MKTFIALLFMISCWAAGAQCTAPVITVSGPTTFCQGGSVTLSAPIGNTWTQKADFGGTGRYGAVSFSIDSKGYIGTGSSGSYYKDFWEYNPATDTWTQKADFSGTERDAATGFSIGSKGYVGTGYKNGTAYRDFWEYNPATNIWTRKADFGGGNRFGAAGFSIGSKGYIGTGNYYKDFWEYNPATDTWTQKADFGGSGRDEAAGFSIGSKGYIGTGSNSNGYLKDFWEYNPSANTWAQKADFGGIGREQATNFSIGSKGYIGNGSTASNVNFYKDFWEYNPANDTWTQKADFGGSTRLDATGFSIGNKGYVGTGGGYGYYKDFWEYDPGYTYIWSPGLQTTPSITVSTAGNYTVTTTDVLGCSNKSAVTTVTVSAFPSATITPSGPTTFCTGGSVTLSAPTGSGFTYLWSPGGATTSSINATASGNYTVRVTNAAGCSTTSSATTITVNTLVTPSVSILASSTNICSSTSVTFTATPTNGGTAPTYKWQKNGVAISGAINATYTTASLANNDVFSVVLTSNATCATPATVTSNAITIMVIENTGGVVYVDSSRTSSGSGASWANAYKELREALNAVRQCSNITSILVAKGTYKPTGNTDRDSAFTILRGGLKIYGGYPTGGGTRNVVANKTILSGDIGTPGTSTDNSYHVLVIAGIDNSADSVVLDGCTISNGTAGGSGTKLYNGQNTDRSNGGGLYLLNNAVGSKIVIRNCSFTNNTGSNGGAVYNEASSPVFSNSNFVSNVAGNQGGAVYVYNHASPAFNNCFFSQNNAQDGGAIGVFFYSPYSVSNCVFVQNNVSERGGALYVVNNSPATITNCTLVQNNALYGGAMSFNVSSNTSIINAIAWGNTATAYPLFFNSNAFVDVVYSIVQGGYAGTGNYNADPLFINTADPDGADNIFGTADDGLKLQAGSPAVNTGSNAAASGITTDITGAARIQNGTVDMGAYEGFTCPATGIVYVDNSIAASGNGSSWTMAYKELSTALAAAQQCSNITTVYVAKGTYKPTNDANRDSTFTIYRGGLKIYGGYPLGGGTRNVTANPTILSGDIGAANDTSDNSYHVMVIAGIATATDSVVVDGFTLQGGTGGSLTAYNYNGQPVWRHEGAGMMLWGNGSGVNIAVRNCSFNQNYCVAGGGMAHILSSANLILGNCSFTQNKAVQSGGGLYNYSASADLNGCTFSDNYSNNEGGGLYQNYAGSLRVKNCRFLNNHSGSGGAIRLLNGDAKFISAGSVYAGNTSSINDAGALSLVMGNGTDTLINNVFIRNVASGGASNGGGAVVEENGTSSYIANNTFYADSAASNSGAIRFKDGGSNRYLYNNIFYKSYNGSANTDVSLASGTTITAQSNNLYSTTDPLFVNESDPDGADNIFGTTDDGLQLQIGSPAVNTGSNAAVPAGIATDIAGAARIQNSMVDMGAYESPYITYSIATAVSATSVCTGATIPVTYTAVGTYNSGYTFTAQLSDASGSFANPITIGSVTATASGVINATIPSGTAAGIGYRIRVVSSTPPITGSDNGNNITINTTPAIPTVSVIQPTCTIATGTIILNTPTGTGITYSIDGTTYQSGTTFNNVTPGNYNVTAKNSNGCVSSSFPVTINVQPASPATPTVTLTQPTCSVATGTITMNTPTGSGITYSIDGTNYQAGTAFSNVASGNYNITAKNSSGCISAALPVAINAQPIAPATPTVGVTQPTCTIATGTITVNTPTGTGITYSINGSVYQASNIFNNVGPGNYNVTAKNSSGCVSSAASVTISAAPSAPATPTVTVTQPTCSTPTGTLTVNSPGGAGITFSIDGTTYQASNVFNNVAPGNYIITAKNSSGCVSVAASVTINSQPATPVTPTVSVTQPTCTIATGSITVNGPTGAGITYSINGSSYYTGNTFTNVAPGNYTVIAANSNGCNSSVPVTINAAPSAPATPTVTVLQPTCAVATGTITVNTPTGTGITYSINGTNYQAGTTFSNIAPGSYNLTAKNSSGCISSSAPVTINAVPATPATPTVSIIQPSCSVATGTITVNSPTGTGITYSIDNTNYQASNVFSNISPGNYSVTAKNSNGCLSAAASVTLNAQPATPAVPTVSVTQPTCSIATGTITVNSPTGAGITYSINGSFYQSGNTFTNVAPGNYSVTAKNSSGCVSVAASVTINAAPSSLATPTVSTTQPTCTAPAGTITVNSPSGAGITYSINGTTYQAGNIFNNVAPGNYNVTAKNSSGCVSATPVTINTILADTQPPSIPSNLTVFLNANGQGSLTPANVAPLITDNCAVNPNSITVSANSFTCFNANAIVAHQAYVSYTSTGNANYDGQFGMSFKVNNANGIMIDKLGAFDDGGNGITGNQNGGVRVAIFNVNTQAIVPGLDVTIAGTADPLVSGSYRMRSITPVTLPVGNYVLVTKGYVGEKFYNRQLSGPLNPVGDNAAGVLTFLNTVYYGNAAAFGFPNQVADAANPNEYIAGTFNYLLSANNTVMVSAADMSGNQSTVTASVTIVDTLYVLTAKNATVTLDANRQATIVPADVLQSLKNNCGVDVTTSTLQVSPSTFGCSDITSGLTLSTTPHQAYVSNTIIGNANYDGQFGMTFRVNDTSGIVIDKLGAFDDGGNGITGSQSGGVRVAIFNVTTQTIVPGLDVTIAGTTDPLAGSYRMRSITPVTLPAGNYVIVTKGYVGEKFYNRQLSGPLNPAGDSAAGTLTFLNTVYYGNIATFGFPNNAANAGNPNEYIAGTFNYKTFVTATGVTVTLTATDVYGHQKQATAQVVVKKVIGPTVVTRNITLNLNSSGNASIVPNDVLQTPVTDNCGLQSVTVSPNSFTCSDYSAGGGNGSPHQAYVSNTSTGNFNYDGQFGMTFKVNNANGIVIDKLGAFDDQGNGITGNQGGGIRVAIFNVTTQAIVPGLDVTIAGSTDPLVGSYRMRSITPVMLPAGNYVIITKGYVGEKFYNRSQAGALNPVGDNAAGVLTFLNTVYYGNAAAFGFPNNVGDASNPNEYIAGTFNYALNGNNNKTVTVTATDIHGNVTNATATVTLTNTSNSCGGTPAPVMAYATKSVQTEVPVVVDNITMSIKVYPNPSSGQFTVQLSNLKASKVSLQIMDGNGQVVLQQQATPSSKTPVLSIPVDISKQASGVYLIRVISADGVQTAKVVVSR